MMSYFRRLVGPIRLRWSLQLCHFSAIGPAGARASRADFVSVVIAQIASLRPECPCPHRETRKTECDHDPEHDAQDFNRRGVLGVIDSERLKRALETMQHVI